MYASMAYVSIDLKVLAFGLIQTVFRCKTMCPRKESNNPRKFSHNRFEMHETHEEHAIMLWVCPFLPSAAEHRKPGFEAWKPWTCLGTCCLRESAATNRPSQTCEQVLPTATSVVKPASASECGSFGEIVVGFPRKICERSRERWPSLCKAMARSQQRPLSWCNKSQTYYSFDSSHFPWALPLPLRLLRLPPPPPRTATTTVLASICHYSFLLKLPVLRLMRQR